MMRLIPARAILLLGLTALAPLGTARAGESAQEFMDRVFNRSSWKDMEGQVTLTLTNKAGQTKTRQIDMWSRTNASDESSMLMRFVKPADVRGTGFLSIEHKQGEDDRRLFLPALRRVNRISTSGSGGNFMSSDFTYYDVGRPKLADWKFQFSGEKPIEGIACKAVTGTAVSKKVVTDTGYSRVTWYVDPARLISLGADYFDKDGRPLKGMVVLKVEQVSGKPFASHMRVEDAQSGHRSEMLFSDLKTDTGVPDKVFTERNLRKWTR